MYKYKAPNCFYPFVPNDKLDYCWGYAGLVDKGASEEEIKKMCIGCEYYKKEEINNG